MAVMDLHTYDNTLYEKVYQTAYQAAVELIETAGMKAGQILVVGCSTSEVGGEKIGTYSSPELAAKLDELALAGNSHITFVIGGAFGYTDALRKRADLALSFSKMTFTHQMIRLLLIEQIYRAFKISRGEKYHW